ncbi:MAG TPA: hypothetical protein VFC19_05050 [Candidatus Limnocylindrales bacterium]|nr:hypothetical protein [Candidatus Limnocylindrales bacterium]
MATSRQDGLDPTGAQTPEAFMQLLGQARTESGLSIVEIVERARERGYDLDAVGLNRALASPTLPPWQIVTGVLTACGRSGMQIDRWMRVYHDLATPAQLAASVTAVLKPVDVQPVSVPPLVLTPASAKPARLGRRNVAIAAGTLAALIMLPLLLFALSNSEPGTVAAEATTAAPTPSSGDWRMAPPWPTGTAAATTPAPVTTTVKPPPRTTAPPSPPPSPSPSPHPSPSPANPGVLRSGVVVLTGDQAFDLDSGQPAGVPDIFRLSGNALARLNSSLLEPMSGMPSKPACQAEQGWETWVGNLRAGQWLCVRTSDNRYGRLNITATGETLKLSYTVWT